GFRALAIDARLGVGVPSKLRAVPLEVPRVEGIPKQHPHAATHPTAGSADLAAFPKTARTRQAVAIQRRRDTLNPKAAGVRVENTPNDCRLGPVDLELGAFAFGVAVHIELVLG